MRKVIAAAIVATVPVVTWVAVIATQVGDAIAATGAATLAFAVAKWAANASVGNRPRRRDRNR